MIKLLTKCLYGMRIMKSRLATTLTCSLHDTIPLAFLHGLAVIVAGGATCCHPLTMTGVVEFLHIKECTSLFSKSQWSVVERYRMLCIS